MTSDRFVDVSVSDAFESAVIKSDVIDETRIEKLVQSILNTENIKWHRMGVIFSTHDHVRELNRSFLDHDYETDVLSFIVDESDVGLEGEVYIDVEMALERHEEFGASLSNELERYVAHGILHLAGYDDATPDEKAHMHALEDRYVALLD